MDFTGLIFGFFLLVIIGAFHPLVIKAYYYRGDKAWRLFLYSAIVFSFLSISIKGPVRSIVFGTIAAASIWSIHEVKEQKRRVEKGWFPRNPNK